jgi:muramoyltetrapeptide carboxypeptidase
MQPAFLQQGDTIGIIATARFITSEQWQYAKGVIESWGLKIKCAENVFKPAFQLAGNVEERTQSFLSLWKDDTVKALLVARGGYGTVHTIDEILPHLNDSKWICGYSDVTVLLNACTNKDIACIHSTMPISFEHATPEALENLRCALFGESFSFEWNEKQIQPGTTEGQIVGGNLSVIYSQLGSPTQLNAEGKILFLEDVDEMLYHIDRMFTALKRAGMFKNIQGLIIGGFTQMKDNTEEFGFSTHNPWGMEVREMILQLGLKEQLPIAWDFPAGHLNDNRAFYMGRNAELIVNENSAQLTWK